MIRRSWSYRKSGPWLVVAAAAAALSLVGAGPAMAATPAKASPHYPVPYTFLAGIVAGATGGPDVSPPGANNWSCKPSRQHPNPVVLVHGLAANEDDNWQTFSPLLADNGYCVFALTYGVEPGAQEPESNFGGFTTMESSALQLSAFVNRVLSSTGARKVDMLGHSEGATMPYWYMKFDGGYSKVSRFVGLAPVVHGSDAGGQQQVIDVLTALGQPNAEAQFVSQFCQACAEFAPSSPFIQKLDAGGIAVKGVVYTQIMTRYDELVVPYTSGMIVAPNSTNIVVQDQCPLDFADHISLAADPVAAQDVLNALDPAHAGRVPCVPVAPVVG